MPGCEPSNAPIETGGSIKRHPENLATDEELEMKSPWRSVYLWSVTASILGSTWLVVMPSTAAGISSGVYPLSPGKAAVAVNPSNGRQYVFWLGSDERIHEAWYNGGWRGPRTMSWRASSAPAVAVSDTGRQDVFWQATNGHIAHAWFAAGSWHGPVERGWQAVSAPGVAVNPSNGRQYVFWLGSDERIHEAWYNGGWRGPRTMSWRASSAPAVAVSDTGRQDVFWQATNRRINQAWYTGGSWHGPVDQGSSIHPSLLGGCVPTGSSFVSHGSTSRRSVALTFDDVRRPFRKIDQFCLVADLVLAFTAEPFEYPRSDWSGKVGLVGPGLWEPPAEPPPWLADVHRPLVLVTCSTLFQNDRKIAQIACESLRQRATRRRHHHSRDRPSHVHPSGQRPDRAVRAALARARPSRLRRRHGHHPESARPRRTRCRRPVRARPARSGFPSKSPTPACGYRRVNSPQPDCEKPYAPPSSSGPEHNASPPHSQRQAAQPPPPTRSRRS